MPPKVLTCAPTFHSRALKQTKTRTVEIPPLHLTEAREYGNPLLGIEVSLGARLRQDKQLYHNSVDRRKELLLNALEDVANLNMGFKRDILDVIRCLRKPRRSTISVRVEPEDEFPEVDDLAELKQLKEKIVRDMEAEIESLSSTVSELTAEFESLKTSLFLEPDIFAEPREVSTMLGDIQKAYDAMFRRKPGKSDDTDCRALSKDVNMLRREFAGRQVELHLAKQITKRLSFFVQRKGLG
jgi:hypothetical protein